MRDFTAGEQQVFNWITSSRQAFVKIGDLGELDIEDLDRLIREGLVASWLLGGESLVTLTPLGAEILGVILIECKETLPAESPKRSTKEEYPCSTQRAYWDQRDPKTGRGIHETPFVIMPRFPYRESEDILLRIPDPAPGPDVLRHPDGQPIRIFKGENGDGYTIEIDLRMAKRRIQQKSGRSHNKRPRLGPNLGHNAPNKAPNGSNSSISSNGQKTQVNNSQNVSSSDCRYRLENSDTH